MEVEILPRKPKHPCSHPGCPELVEYGERYCEKHLKEENKRYEKYDRDPAVRRRYGRARKRIRDSYAAAHPLCELCMEKGIYTKTEEIHQSCRCPRVGRMTAPTSSPCASRAMRGFMRNVVTDGTTEQRCRMPRGRGGANLCAASPRERCGGQTHKILDSNGVLTPRS